MNPVEKALRRADLAHQRRQPAAFLFGVIKKFGDDNGGALVSNLAYTGFVSVFPLLLILVAVLVNIATGDPSKRSQVVRGATMQFPLIGKQLASKRPAGRCGCRLRIAHLGQLAINAHFIEQACRSQCQRHPCPAATAGPGPGPGLGRGTVPGRSSRCR
jgi:hypothetical protein